MKVTMMLMFSLLFVISCGRNNDNNNNLYGVNPVTGQPCNLNSINAYNGYNGFYNNYQYGMYNPYQLRMAYGCGMALNNNLYNNTYGYGQGNCVVPAEHQDLAEYREISTQNIQRFNEEIAAELRDVHGVNVHAQMGDSNQNGEGAEHYYTQVGFNAGVYTNSGYGGYGYGGYQPYGVGGYPYSYCDQLPAM